MGSQPQIITTIIALIGAAIIVPLVKKFYFDVQNILRVEVRAFSAKTSEAVQKIVIGTLPPNSFFDPMAQIVNSRGYIMVTITNISKRKISGISATLSKSAIEMFCQLDDDGEVIAAKIGTKIDVWDIQPKHSRIIHMWYSVDTADFSFWWLKHFLQISANELDSVRIRFPMSRYIRNKYEVRLQHLVLILSLTLPITALCALLYFALTR